ncbi:hypothetical protein EUTSA_v10028260mg, partial [Eutrema salsugineum]
MKKLKCIEASNQTFSSLPFDLTVLILERLSLKDNIRASIVCKTWLEACISVRAREYPTPLLMRSPCREEYELYDPSLNKTHICKSSPVLGGSHIHCSTDGWLLVRHRNFRDTFFLNPFTHERIGLPWPDMGSSLALASSCAPTSNSCVIFSVSDFTEGSITIKTYRLATKVCTSFKFPHRLPWIYGGFEHVVFSNGVFYLLARRGWLGMFDLSTNSWDLLRRPPPKIPGKYYRFMTEYHGDIFLIYTDMNELTQPRYLKLNLTKRKWEDEKFSGGLTFYLSFVSTLTMKRDFVHTHKVHQCT